MHVANATSRVIIVRRLVVRHGIFARPRVAWCHTGSYPPPPPFPPQLICTRPRPTGAQIKLASVIRRRTWRCRSIAPVPLRPLQTSRTASPPWLTDATNIRPAAPAPRRVPSLPPSSPDRTDWTWWGFRFVLPVLYVATARRTSQERRSVSGPIFDFRSSPKFPSDPRLGLPCSLDRWPLVAVTSNFRRGQHPNTRRQMSIKIHFFGPPLNIVYSYALFD